ncbi:calcium homeostasis endoplasmic reticulum protein [Tetranychus urticae]|uniref:DUF7819 domain-containing protein n=1 Tax=Tetranychus urticae TaxID=32264 RepID=T1KH46_TETUR|nr:calcium homeostasis endoplasmic reticulum protein [Tetranychus urticae]
MSDQRVPIPPHQGVVAAPPMIYDYWNQQPQQKQSQQQQQQTQQQQHRATSQNMMDYGHPPPIHQPPPSNVPLYHPPPMVGPLPMHIPPSQHHPMIAQIPPPPPSFAPPPNAQIQLTSVPNPQFFSTVPPPPRPPTTGPPLAAPQPPIIPKEPTRPDAPYYELPAGLMVPLVKLEDFEYQPLDPDQIRLPPPAPVSERLLKAVEAFYAPPSHDRPRNEDGWEQLSLYEFFRLKSQAKNAGKET